MSRSDAWMPLYIGDYLADTMHLSTVEHGAYVLLLMHYWRNGPLADDDKVLAGIARVDRKAWDKGIGETIRSFFSADAGRLRQKRMDQEREKAGQISSKRKAAADARWAAKGEQEVTTSNANADANAFQMDTHAGARPSASPSQSPVQEKKDPPASRVPQQRGSRLAHGWVPSQELHDFAKDLGLNVDSVAAAFRDYWIAVPGSKGVKLDWPATWRRWCRTEAERRSGPSGRPQRKTADQMIADYAATHRDEFGDLLEPTFVPSERIFP